MALIACTDKQKKHRVKASGSLVRTDYYCPHNGCDAILILVDCDDEIRTDHFRTKIGFSHNDSCPYRQNDIFLLENEFTNVENQILEEVLTKLRADFEFLGNQIFDELHKMDIPVADIHTHSAYYKVPLNAKSEKDIRKASRPIGFVWMEI